MKLGKGYLVRGLFIIACYIIRRTRGESCGELQISKERVYVSDSVQLTLIATSWARINRIWWKAQASRSWEEVYPNVQGNERITESTTPGKYVLYISNVTTQDAGTIVVSCYNRNIMSSALTLVVEERTGNPLDNVLTPPTLPEFVNRMNFVDCEHCIPAIPGESMEIECLSYNGTLPVSINLFQNDKKVFSKNMLSYSNHWRKVVSAKIRITGTLNDIHAEYRCTVQNAALVIPLEAGAKLYALKTPSDPIVANKNSMEGSVSGIVCSSSGGRPAPNIRFRYNDTDFQGEQEISYNPSVQTFLVKSKFAEVMSRYDNQRSYECCVDYINGYRNLSRCRSWNKLNISFIPLSVHIEEMKISRQDNGTTELQLRCHVGESNPASHVRWRRLKNTKRSIGDLVSTIGRFGGWTVTQELNLTLHREDNGRMIECEAANTMYPSLLKTVSYQADITYSPLVSIQEESNRTVQLGEHVYLTCLCDANPLATLRWFDKKGNVISAASSVRRLVLEIHSVSKSDNGIYTCVANNHRGHQQERSVSLTVQDISKTDGQRVDDSDTSDTSVGIIIAILLTIVVIAVIAVLLICYKKRRDNQSPKKDNPVQIQFENRQPSIQPPADVSTEPVYSNINRAEDDTTEEYVEYAQVIPKSKRNKQQDTKKEDQMNESGLLYVQLDLPNVESRRASAQSRKSSATKEKEDEAPTQYISIDFTRTGKPVLDS